ncbi:hypothetical protein HHI36_001908 [Cryptolaemus montrouzieri]|uniref:Transposase n=1 Tax=Cryptolaemus montrouzieri TaxID=559131 RepID=A0ABD2P8V2_9CUCU
MHSCITNLHNEHMYSVKNPHHQNQFKINAWISVIDNFIIGPVVIPDPLNGEAYLNFLQETLPDLLDDIPLILRAEMFMHDGAPPHFTLAVREFLHAQKRIVGSERELMLLQVGQHDIDTVRLLSLGCFQM